MLTWFLPPLIFPLLPLEFPSKRLLTISSILSSFLPFSPLPCLDLVCFWRQCFPADLSNAGRSFPTVAGCCNLEPVCNPLSISPKLPDIRSYVKFLCLWGSCYLALYATFFLVYYSCPPTSSSLLYSLKFFFIFFLFIDFRERKEERKRDRERETLICCSTYLCIHWLILVDALTGD